jgi:hypothetical protein
MLSAYSLSDLGGLGDLVSAICHVLIGSLARLATT